MQQLSSISRSELEAMAESTYGTLVKDVVDVRQGLLHE